MTQAARKRETERGMRAKTNQLVHLLGHGEDSVHGQLDLRVQVRRLEAAHFLRGANVPHLSAWGKGDGGSEEEKKWGRGGRGEEAKCSTRKQRT